MTSIRCISQFNELRIDAEADCFTFFHRLIELNGGIGEITNFNVIFGKWHATH